MTKYLAFGLISVFFMQCPAKNDNRSFKSEVFTSSEGHELPLRILYPDNYSKSKSYPMLIFLHGSGERGSNNQDQLVHIAPSFLTDEFQAKHEAIIVFPQCAENDSWARMEEKEEGSWLVQSDKPATSSTEALFEWINVFKMETSIDPTRTYLAGLSMGGFGTMDILYRRPNMFAAAVPICGGGNYRFTSTIRQVPIWIFHGAKDPLVPVSLSRSIAESCKALNMNYRYTEYPEGGHDVWNKAWEEPGLVDWIFSQQLQTSE